MSESLPPPPPPPGVTGPPPPPGWTPPPTPPSPDGGSRTGLIIGVVVAVLAALGVGAFFLFRDDSGEAAPEDTDPELTIADVTIPEITIPDLTIPDVTIPDITIPDISVPDLTLPDFTLPADDPAPGDVPPATQEPDGLGDDPQLDSLAQDCYDGDMQACDDLYQESPVNSDYQTYGDTCAGRQPALTQRFCINTFPS